jgi:hypothetical protein
MAYDQELAERIRGLLPAELVTEKSMFGGLAFLVGGHLAVSASGRGGLMVRCDPADSDRLVELPGASRLEMRGREMDGWLRVTGEAVADDDALAEGPGGSFASSGQSTRLLQPYDVRCPPNPLTRAAPKTTCKRATLHP